MRCSGCGVVEGDLEGVLELDGAELADIPLPGESARAGKLFASSTAWSSCSPFSAPSAPSSSSSASSPCSSSSSSSAGRSSSGDPSDEKFSDKND